MRHFDFIDDSAADRLFQRAPEPFAAGHDPRDLGSALGATLYCPAVRPALAHDIVRRRQAGVQSVVICLEDAVADAELAHAERNVVAALAQLHGSVHPLPLVFVRVRDAGQIPMIIDLLGDRLDALTGFVLPKFDGADGEQLMAAVEAARACSGRDLLAMPVIEGRPVAHLETRAEALIDARRLVDKHAHLVPAVRIGGTDLSAVWGLRRPRELTVWDLRPVADALGDIVNVFGRSDGGYPVSGAVWEYIPSADPRTDELGGLVREVALDRANGLAGKTVIHPAHVPVVNAMSVVTADDHADALDILASARAGGAVASTSGTRMNESKPHTAWASQVVQRARFFGVARPGVDLRDLLAACRAR